MVTNGKRNSRLNQTQLGSRVFLSCCSFVKPVAEHSHYCSHAHGIAIGIGDNNTPGQAIERLMREKPLSLTLLPWAWTIVYTTCHESSPALG